MTRPAPTLTRAALALSLAAAMAGCDAPASLTDAEPTPPVTGEQASNITVTGQVTDVLSGRRLNSAQVCVHADFESPCAYSDTDGRFTLAGVPGNAQVALEITRSSFQSMLVPVTTTSAGEHWQLDMMSEVFGAVQARRIGVDQDDDSGQLRVRIDQGRDAVRFAAADASPAPDAGPTIISFIPQAPRFDAEREVATDARVLRWWRDPQGTLRRQRPGPDGAFDMVPRVATHFDVPTVPTRSFRTPYDDAIEAPLRGMQGLRVKPFMSIDETVAYMVDGLVDKGQRRTSADGGAMVFNMRPGLRMTAIEAPLGDISCSADFGWLHPKSDRVVVFPIEPGFTTYINTDCSRTF